MPTPGDIAAVTIGGHKLEPLDLSNAPAGALSERLADGATQYPVVVDSPNRPTHGLTPAEVEAVRARRAAMGPFERSAWQRIAANLSKPEPKARR
jgi:hypothetical protein